jgi:hypothetical protein
MATAFNNELSLHTRHSLVRNADYLRTHALGGGAAVCTRTRPGAVQHKPCVTASIHGMQQATAGQLLPIAVLKVLTQH